MKVQKITPLKPQRIAGSRTLAREKLLQLFVATEISEHDPFTLFPYIFPYNFRMEEPPAPHRFLRPEEIAALDSDITIQWKESEIQFARRYIERYKTLEQEIVSLIQKFSINWSYDRLTVIDRVILKMGVTELLSFPDIPPQVTINEAVELAKKFSTEKSGVFVNGVLDAIHHFLEKEQLLHSKAKED